MKSIFQTVMAGHRARKNEARIGHIRSFCDLLARVIPYEGLSAQDHADSLMVWMLDPIDGGTELQRHCGVLHMVLERQHMAMKNIQTVADILSVIDKKKDTDDRVHLTFRSAPDNGRAGDLYRDAHGLFKMRKTEFLTPRPLPDVEADMALLMRLSRVLDVNPYHRVLSIGDATFKSRAYADAALRKIVRVPQ